MICVISFALYGTNPKYSDGLFENLALMQRHFPGWKAYVYIAPDVPEPVRSRLECIDFVVLRPTGVIGDANKIFRFFAIDEPDVDYMFVRDTDSRLHWKDRWAIRQFCVYPAEYTVHVIRDNREHTAPMPGGLWAARKPFPLSVRTLYESYNKKDIDDRWMRDQNFLADCIHPFVRRQVLVHYSKETPRWQGEYTIPFPFPWTEETYCGRVQTGPFLDSNAPPTRPALNFLRINK